MQAVVDCFKGRPRPIRALARNRNLRFSTCAEANITGRVLAAPDRDDALEMVDGRSDIWAMTLIRQCRWPLAYDVQKEVAGFMGSA
ncbi:MAG: hypothetical protein ACYCTF_00115 [Acidiferrobacter sp.]